MHISRENVFSTTAISSQDFSQLQSIKASSSHEHPNTKFEKTPNPKKEKEKRTTQQMATRFQWRTSSTDWAQFNSSNRHGTNYSTTERDSFSPTSDSISIRICCCNLRLKLLKQILLQLRFSKHESRDAIDRSIERASERAKDRKK